MAVADGPGRMSLMEVGFSLAFGFGFGSGSEAVRLTCACKGEGEGLLRLFFVMPMLFVQEVRSLNRGLQIQL